jgi:putative sigma-54 modulation protein
MQQPQQLHKCQKIFGLWYDNGINAIKKFMDVIIQSLGFKAGESLENYIREKISKLTPNDHIVRANVTLYLGATKANPDTWCEIRLEVPGNDLFVKESAQDNFEQAVDATVNKLQGILRKQKEKQVDQWQSRGN